MIKSIDKLKGRPCLPFCEIDLTGPDGNVLWLLGRAKRLAIQLNKDPGEIIMRMTAGDYENLLNVFESEFGDYITIYR